MTHYPQNTALNCDTKRQNVTHQQKNKTKLRDGNTRKKTGNTKLYQERFQSHKYCEFQRMLSFHLTLPRSADYILVFIKGVAHLTGSCELDTFRSCISSYVDACRANITGLLPTVNCSVCSVKKCARSSCTCWTSPRNLKMRTRFPIQYNGYLERQWRASYVVDILLYSCTCPN